MDRARKLGTDQTKHASALEELPLDGRCNLRRWLGFIFLKTSLKTNHNSPKCFISSAVKKVNNKIGHMLNNSQIPTPSLSLSIFNRPSWDLWQGMNQLNLRGSLLPAYAPVSIESRRVLSCARHRLFGRSHDSPDRKQGLQNTPTNVFTMVEQPRLDQAIPSRCRRPPYELYFLRKLCR